MTSGQLTSLERVLAALAYQEADRVPLFLNLTTTGARELGLSIKAYYASADQVVRGQLLMKNKYSNDMVTNFLYSAAEVEAWGAEVVFFDDGPPNSGQPFIRQIEDIDHLTVPDIGSTPCLLKGLNIAQRLKDEVKDETPIIGAVTSPFSLPVMQLGFDKYLELIYFRRNYFDKLMRINEEYCAAWANAQIKAGATVISYANPLASPTIIDRATYLKTGFEVDQRTIGRIKGGVATDLASGICLPVLEDLIKTGTIAIETSAQEDIGEVKRAAAKRLTIIGNFNALAMVSWDLPRVESEIKEIIARAGRGGGLIVSDNHGEIPYQISEAILLKIAETVREYGQYPLKWIEENA